LLVSKFTVAARGKKAAPPENSFNVGGENSQKGRKNPPPNPLSRACMRKRWRALKEKKKTEKNQNQSINFINKE
jgi:hypothetical protein